MILPLMVCCILLPTAFPATAQDVALRSDALYWLTTTPNLGVTLSFGDRWESSFAVGYNPFKFPSWTNERGVDQNPKLMHWLLAAEAGYRFGRLARGEANALCRRRHLIAADLFGGEYNAGAIRFIPALKLHRYDGWAVGAGLRYGYRIPLGKRWAFEPSAGVAYLHLGYDKYWNGRCGRLIKSGRRNCLIPQISLTFLYTIPKSTRRNKGADAVYDAPADIPISPAPQERRGEPGDSVREQKRVSEPGECSQSLCGERSECIAFAESVESAENATRRESFSVTFPVDKAELSAYFASNKVELSRLDSLITSLSPEEIASVRIKGFASPEYKSLHNRNLSSRRAQSAVEYLALRFGLHADCEVCGEDWDGLESLLAESSLPAEEKSEVRRILQSPDKEEVKRRLQGLRGGAPLRRLCREIYPQLRRAQIEIVYIIK